MIERNIFVTKETITQPIAYVENTNMLPIVLHIRDYDLPEGAAARAYVLKQSNMTVLCEVSGNDVTIPVASGLFSPGENTMQLRIVQGEDKLLITFPIKVNVKRDITGDDASEPQDNPSVMDQLVAKYGEILEELKKDETDVAGLKNQIGLLSALETAVKTSVVAAINWLKEKLDAISDEIEDVKDDIDTLDSKLDGKSGGFFAFPVCSYTYDGNKNNVIIATFPSYMMSKYTITCTSVNIIGEGVKSITSQVVRANGIEILCQDVADFGGSFARCTFSFTAK